MLQNKLHECKNIARSHKKDRKFAAICSDNNRGEGTRDATQSGREGWLRADYETMRAREDADYQGAKYTLSVILKYMNLFGILSNYTEVLNYWIILDFQI